MAGSVLSLRNDVTRGRVPDGPPPVAIVAVVRRSTGAALRRVAVWCGTNAFGTPVEAAAAGQLAPALHRVGRCRAAHAYRALVAERAAVEGKRDLRRLACDAGRREPQLLRALARERARELCARAGERERAAQILGVQCDDAPLAARIGAGCSRDLERTAIDPDGVDARGARREDVA
jgi:hypothetical protein